MSETIRFIDLFGGIGGFRHGLEQSSDKFKCVDYIEYDKYAVKSYNEIFKEDHEPRDVTQLQTEQIPEHDLLCAGFPCQAFSIAGNRQGTDEARGKLFREIVRIARAKEPEMLLLENVKGILSQKAVTEGEAVEGTKGHAFRNVLQALHELGYCLEWQVLNSKHWGVPQNRERVFIVGHLGGEPQRKVFPIERKDRENNGENGREIGLLRDKGEFRTKRISNCLDANYWKGMDNRGARTHILNPGMHSTDAVHHPNGVASTVRAKAGGKTRGLGVLQIPRGQNAGGFHRTCPTVSSNSWHENNFLKEDTKILNHQFRPESRPSVEEDGQSGGSGLLYNSDYSYALSSSPHYAVEPVHTPGFAEKDMNMKSCVGSSDGSMFTITGSIQHGIIDWTPLQRKRTEKAKEIRRKHRQKHGEDYSPMSEYTFGLKEEDNFHTVTSQPEKSH